MSPRRRRRPDRAVKRYGNSSKVTPPLHDSRPLFLYVAQGRSFAREFSSVARILERASGSFGLFVAITSTLKRPKARPEPSTYDFGNGHDNANDPLEHPPGRFLQGISSDAHSTPPSRRRQAKIANGSASRSPLPLRRQRAAGRVTTRCSCRGATGRWRTSHPLRRRGDWSGRCTAGAA